MSQSDFGNLVSPLPGPEFIDGKLEPWRDAVHSMHSGSTRPSYAIPGLMWLDNSVTPWAVKVFQGSDDVIMGYLDTTTLKFTSSTQSLNNFTATTNPTNTDDEGDGFSAGSQWINQTSGFVFLCIVATAGNAVWVKLLREGGDATVNDLTVLGNIIQSSDITLKMNIAPLESMIPSIMALAPVGYKRPASPEKLETGFIAQQVQEVFPHLVSIGADKKLAVNYIGIIAILTRAVQEQQFEINQLKKSINKGE